MARDRGMLAFLIIAAIAAALIFVPTLRTVVVETIETVTTTVVNVVQDGLGIGKTFGPGTGTDTWTFELDAHDGSWSCMAAGNKFNMTIDGSPLNYSKAQLTPDGSDKFLLSDPTNFTGTIGSSHVVSIEAAWLIPPETLTFAFFHQANGEKIKAKFSGFGC